MLRPRDMVRVVATGSRDHLEDVVSILYDAQAVHLIAHDAEDEEVPIGDPMDASEDLSEALVFLRSAKQKLDLGQEHRPEEPIPAARIEEDLEARIFDLRTNLNSIEEDRDRLRDALGDLEEQIRRLEPFAELPLTGDQYGGYRTLTCLTGRLDGDVETLLDRADVEGGAFSAGDVHAVLVRDDDVDRAREVLTSAGWTDLPAPEIDGDVRSRLSELREEASRFEQKLDRLDEKLDELRTEHGAFVLAAEEHLSIEVEKAEAPMQFASTDNAFVLEGWVPQDKLEKVQNRVRDRFGESIHVETTGSKTIHHRPEPDDEQHGHEDEPPTQLQNEGPAKPFEFVTNLMSRPQYDEIDPTSLLAIFFPVMFGLMIGDVGYGIAVFALGAYLADNEIFGIGGAQIGKVLKLSGIFTIVFGGIVYMEMFGLHFIYPQTELHHLGGEFVPPTWADFIVGHEAAVHLSEQIHLPIIGTAANASEGIVLPLAKLQSLPQLMQISIWLAVIHLSIGFVLAFLNEKDHHGVSEAFRAQFGWMAVTWGWFFVIVVGMLGGPLLFGWLPLDGFPAFVSMAGMDGHAVSLGVTLVAIGAVSLGSAEPEGIVELFGVLSNMVSYARLAAIGIAKAGFVFVFNIIAFQTMGGSLLAIPVLVVAHAVVFSLGLISSGVQSLRLNFYEFFSKFYEGGGHPYHPFGRRREYTER